MLNNGMFNQGHLRSRYMHMTIKLLKIKYAM